LVALKRVVVRSGWLACWRQSLVALKRVGVFILSFSRAAGWTPGGGDGGDLKPSRLVTLLVEQVFCLLMA
jgi:hypothetical protein